MSYPKRPLRERFWRNVIKTDTCWIWASGRFGRGYGAFKWTDGRTIQAHRAAWMLERGTIGSGLFVCHICDVRLCVRPDHLFLGTNSDNQRDAAAKGILRGHPGDEHPMRKVSSVAVQEMRRSSAKGTDAVTIARQFGLSRGHTYDILSGRAWRVSL